MVGCLTLCVHHYLPTPTCLPVPLCLSHYHSSPHPSCPTHTCTTRRLPACHLPCPAIRLLPIHLLPPRYARLLPRATRCLPLQLLPVLYPLCLYLASADSPAIFCSRARACALFICLNAAGSRTYTRAARALHYLLRIARLAHTPRLCGIVTLMLNIGRRGRHLLVYGLR